MLDKRLKSYTLPCCGVVMYDIRPYKGVVHITCNVRHIQTYEIVDERQLHMVWSRPLAQRA